jgi:hypothetical protein
MQRVGALRYRASAPRPVAQSALQRANRAGKGRRLKLAVVRKNWAGHQSLQFSPSSPLGLCSLGNTVLKSAGNNRARMPNTASNSISIHPAFAFVVHFPRTAGQLTYSTKVQFGPHAYSPAENCRILDGYRSSCIERGAFARDHAGQEKLLESLLVAPQAHGAVKIVPLVTPKGKRLYRVTACQGGGDNSCGAAAA